MRVAIVHDWLTGMRGGERVLEAILSIYPDADLYTILYLPGRLSPTIERRRIRTSFIQRLPGGPRRHQYLLPLLPLAVEQFDLTGYDLVLSTSHCVALGAITPAGVPHLSYVHTPMRYVWVFYKEYFAGNPAVDLLMRPFAHYLRMWDFGAAQRVDALAANSENVRRRIQKFYRRDATVIYPPIEMERIRAAARAAEEGGEPAAEEPGEAFLMVTALTPYKRVEVALGAFRRTGKPLVIVGTGPSLPRLRTLAPQNVRFVGRVKDSELFRLYRTSIALVQTSEEDFGMAPLEAQASGRPSIAYRVGGASEAIQDGVTGVLFDEQSVDSLEDALRDFEPERFPPERCRENAARFDVPRFRAQFLRWVESSASALPHAAPGR